MNTAQEIQQFTSSETEQFTSPDDLTDSDRRLINRVQSQFPVCDDPFALIAVELRMTKGEVLARLKTLQEKGVFSRFGAVLNHRRIGKSLLAAMKVPTDRIDEIANLISNFDEINHNYLREHEFNLWFVIAAENEEKVDSTIASIEQGSGLPVMRLPMEKAYHLNLAFAL